MVDLLLVLVAIAYLTVVGLLFSYGLNFFYMTFLALKHSPPDPSYSPPGVLPRVTVQLPIYNELYVAERLVEAAARLDYPAELLEIQVLDDSTDDTGRLLESAVNRLRARGVDICRIHRTNRQGYKAGALAAGLQVAQGEFLAVFDADFLPPANFLMKTIPYFQDPKVAFIQTRWGHINQGYSLLTRLQSLAIDAHFMIEQSARSRRGYWFNFNGTAGIWRKEAIQAAGGWKADTLTEDLDLSYRAFLSGWHGVYLRDVEVPAELPVSMAAFRRQQQRWAHGSLECSLKHIPSVWKAPLSTLARAEATFHLTGYGVHLLQVALCLLYPLVLVVTHRYPGLISLWGVALVLNLTAFAPSFFFVAAQHKLGRNWLQLLPVILFLNITGSGMMVNTARAAWQIIRHNKEAFERTPKFGVENIRVDWASRRYQLQLDPIVVVEIGFGLFNAFTVVMAIQSGNWGIAFYALLFAVGLVYIAALSIVQSLIVHHHNVTAFQVEEEAHAHA